MQSEKTKPVIEVSCACIVSEGKIFITQRPYHKANGGLWEFPGGKLGEGELAWDALKREMQEELSADIERVRSMEVSKSETENFILLLHPFVCRFAAPHRLVEPLAAQWVPIGLEVPKRLAPADVPIWNELISFFK